MFDIGSITAHSISGNGRSRYIEAAGDWPRKKIVKTSTEMVQIWSWWDVRLASDLLLGGAAGVLGKEESVLTSLAREGGTRRRTAFSCGARKPLLWLAFRECERQVEKKSEEKREAKGVL